MFYVIGQSSAQDRILELWEQLKSWQGAMESVVYANGAPKGETAELGPTLSFVQQGQHKNSSK